MPLAWFGPAGTCADRDLQRALQALEVGYDLQRWYPGSAYDPKSLLTLPALSGPNGRLTRRHTPVFDLRCLGTEDSYCLELAQRFPGWLIVPPRGLLGAYLTTARTRSDGLGWLTSRLQACQPYLGPEHARALWYERVDWASICRQYEQLRPELALGCLVDGLQPALGSEGSVAVPWPRWPDPPCSESPARRGVGRARVTVLVGRAVVGWESLLLEQFSRLVRSVQFTLVLPLERAADWHRRIAGAGLNGIFKVLSAAPGETRFPWGNVVVNLHAADSETGWNRQLRILAQAGCSLAVEGSRPGQLPCSVELVRAGEFDTLARRIEDLLATPWILRQRGELGSQWLREHFRLERFLTKLASALEQTPQRYLALMNDRLSQRTKRIVDSWLPTPHTLKPLQTLALKPAQRAEEAAGRRVAVLTPLPPARSGIATHNAMMLPFLQEFCEVDLVHDGTTTDDPLLTGRFELMPPPEFQARQRWNPHRQAIYHMGNNPVFHAWMLPLLREFPGVVVFHDIYLGMLINLLRYTEGLSRFAEEVIYCNGARGREQVAQARRGEICWDDLTWEMLNRRIVERATRLIVPSAWDQARLLEERPEAEGRTAIVPLAVPIPEAVDRSASRARLGLADEHFLVASFGFIVESKSIHLLIQGLVRFLLSNPKAQLVLVGHPEGDYGARCVSLAKETGLGEQIAFTGFTSEHQYHDLLAAADLCIQLRNRSRGGGSYTIHQALAYGIPTLISNAGPFADFPDAVVAKVEPGEELELSAMVSALYQDEPRRRALGVAGRRHASQVLDPRHCARLLYEQVELAEAAPRFR